MKERLPIWFQGLAIIQLSGVFIATICWVWEQDRTNDRPGAIVNVAHDSIYVMIPLPILFLGVRFFWRFIRADDIHWVSLIIGSIALIFLVPVMLTLAILGPSPRMQVIRGASNVVKPLQTVIRA